MSAWISVKKSLPESGVMVLVHLLAHPAGFDPQHYYDLAFWWSAEDSSGGKEHWSTVQEINGYWPITHWQPLPASPKND